MLSLGLRSCLCVFLLSLTVIATAERPRLRVAVLFPMHLKQAKESVAAFAMALEDASKVPARELGSLVPPELRDSDVPMLSDVDISISFNSSSTEQDVQRIALSLVKEGVDVVFGAGSSPLTISLGHVLAVNKVPLICSWSTSSLLTEQSLFPMFLRTVAPDRMQGQALAHLAMSFGWRQVAVLASDDSYGLGLADDFRTSCEKLGITTPIIGKFAGLPLNVHGNATQRVAFDTAHRDLEVHLATIRREGLRVVLVSASALNARRVLRFAKSYNMTGKGWAWLGSDAWMDLDAVDVDDTQAQNEGFADAKEVLDTVVSAGVFGTSPYGGNTSDLAYSRFEQRFSTSVAARRFGEQERITSPYTLYSYDAGWTIANAVRGVMDNGLASDVSRFTSPTSLFKYMAKANFFSLTGQVSFDSDGDRLSSYTISQIVEENGTARVEKYGVVDLSLQAPWSEQDAANAIEKGLIFGGGSQKIPNYYIGKAGYSVLSICSVNQVQLWNNRRGDFGMPCGKNGQHDQVSVMVEAINSLNGNRGFPIWHDSDGGAPNYYRINYTAFTYGMNANTSTTPMDAWLNEGEPMSRRVFGDNKICHVIVGQGAGCDDEVIMLQAIVADEARKPYFTQRGPRAVLTERGGNQAWFFSSHLRSDFYSGVALREMRRKGSSTCFVLMWNTTNRFFRGLGEETVKLAATAGLEVSSARYTTVEELDAGLERALEKRADSLVLVLQSAEVERALSIIERSRPRHAFHGIWYNGLQYGGGNCNGFGARCTYFTAGNQIGSSEAWTGWSDTLIDQSRNASTADPSTYEWLLTKSEQAGSAAAQRLANGTYNVRYADTAMIVSALSQALQSVFEDESVTDPDSLLVSRDRRWKLRDFLASGARVGNTMFGPVSFDSAGQNNGRESTTEQMVPDGASASGFVIAEVAHLELDPALLQRATLSPIVFPSPAVLNCSSTGFEPKWNVAGLGFSLEAPADCAPCDPGFVCRFDESYHLSKEACPSGHACPIGSSEPTPCSSGSFARSTKEDSCEACKPAFFYNVNVERNDCVLSAGNIALSLSIIPLAAIVVFAAKRVSTELNRTSAMHAIRRAARGELLPLGSSERDRDFTRRFNRDGRESGSTFESLCKLCFKQMTPLDKIEPLFRFDWIIHEVLTLDIFDVSEGAWTSFKQNAEVAEKAAAETFESIVKDMMDPRKSSESHRETMRLAPIEDRLSHYVGNPAHWLRPSYYAAVADADKCVRVEYDLTVLPSLIRFNAQHCYTLLRTKLADVFPDAIFEDDGGTDVSQQGVSTTGTAYASEDDVVVRYEAVPLTPMRSFVNRAPPLLSAKNKIGGRVAPEDVLTVGAQKESRIKIQCTPHKSVKKVRRMQMKAKKYTDEKRGQWPRSENIRDSLRASLLCPGGDAIIDVWRAIERNFTVLSLKNKFLDTASAVADDDMERNKTPPNLLLNVLIAGIKQGNEFVEVRPEHTGPLDPAKIESLNHSIVAEIQIHHKEVWELCSSHHKLYQISRAKNISELRNPEFRKAVVVKRESYDNNELSRRRVRDFFRGVSLSGTPGRDEGESDPAVVVPESSPAQRISPVSSPIKAAAKNVAEPLHSLVKLGSRGPPQGLSGHFQSARHGALEPLRPPHSNT